MQLTDTQLAIRDAARRFAEQEIAPHAADWDRTGKTPRAIYRKMAEAGLMGVTVSPEYGGAGADFLSYVLAIEEVSAADGGVSNMMGPPILQLRLRSRRMVRTSKSRTISPN